MPLRLDHVSKQTNSFLIATMIRAQTSVVGAFVLLPTKRMELNANANGTRLVFQSIKSQVF